MKEFKHIDISLLKAGKITKHPTKSNGKEYVGVRLYLKDVSLVGKNLRCIV